jgi:hypothetical protein
MNCISTRSSKPLLLLIRVEQLLANRMREALEGRQDGETTELLKATQDMRRLVCELIQSDLYGGPRHPETSKFVQGSMQLMSVDAWLVRRLAEARASGNSESEALRAARRTIDKLLSEVTESWRNSKHGKE